MSSDRARNVTTCWFKWSNPRSTSDVANTTSLTYEVFFTPPESISNKRCIMRVIGNNLLTTATSVVGPIILYCSGLVFPYNTQTLTGKDNITLPTGTAALTDTDTGYTDTSASTMIHTSYINNQSNNPGPYILTYVPSGPTKLTFNLELYSKTTYTMLGKSIHVVCLEFEPIE